MNEVLSNLADANRKIDMLKKDTNANLSNIDRLRSENLNLQRKLFHLNRKALFTVLIRNSEDLDTCRNQRSQQIKYLQIENEKLRMDLNNETTHGKKLERTVEDLNNRLLDAQNQLRITESKMASR